MQGISIARFRRWGLLSLLNLVIVSILGVLLRYKAAFPLPAVNYKFLLQAHSHFAFSGWLSTALFTAFVHLLSRSGYPIAKAYTYQFWLAQTASFGMLLSFPFEGYGPVSVFFSTLFIVFSWWFAWQYWKDAGKSDLPLPVKKWLKAALGFFVLSGAGPFLLAYSLSHRPLIHGLYQNALYLFLHFQYNGWFSFGVLGVFVYVVYECKLPWEENGGKWFFPLMLWACVPAYCLSLLWMDPPAWVFAIAAIAASLQLAALLLLFLMLRRARAHWPGNLPSGIRLFWGLSLIAFAIKILLQALSVIPALGQFAFGFRAVIVGYLHLVMLGFLSFFLMGYFFQQKLLHSGPGSWRNGCGVFIAGVLLNEFLLLDEVLSPVYHSSFSPYLLFGAALLMFAGLVRLLIVEINHP